MGDFNPFIQNVTFTGEGGQEITIPIAAIDMLNTESFSVCISYGTQLGACILMLVIIVVMTPMKKIARVSNILHISGLVVCIIRMVLLSIYYPGPFMEFYNFWSGDYSRVPQNDYRLSIAGNVFSLLLVVIIEMALMHQAWAMVTLWPKLAKFSLGIISAVVTLLTISWRVAFTVVQSEGILTLTPPEKYRWLIYAMVIINLISIAWYCALFSAKLVVHLIINRGFLPTRGAVTPMEVLVMTNGVLMIVPVIFACLEWGTFTNFEAASLTLTSVAIILPLGTLVARRMAKSTGITYCSSDSHDRWCGAHSRGRGHAATPALGSIPLGTANSAAQLKTSSFTASSRTRLTPQMSVMARCESGRAYRDGTDDDDLELGFMDAQHDSSGPLVRIDRRFEQREERV